jgi:hypothetical protein
MNLQVVANIDLATADRIFRARGDVRPRRRGDRSPSVSGSGRLRHYS